MRITEILTEAANPAQQAAIAVNMKKHHQKPKGVAEGSEQKMSVQDTLAYLKKVMGTESHEDWRNHIINTNEYFVLKDISVNSLKSDLSGLNKTNVEKYKQMDFSKAPPIVIGSDGNILDGYHRANVAKALKVPTLKAWVGVKKQGVAEGENWSKHNHKRVGGMSDKSVKSYRRSHPGSKIQTAVTKKPSKIKKGSKDAKRRASFCARMRGMKKHRTSAKTARDPNSNINKSLRRWHCESIEQMQELVMLAEQFIRNHKK